MAVDLTAAALRDELGLQDDAAGNRTATRLLAIVSAEIALYAPSAPVDTQNEAAIRQAGWLNASDASMAIFSEVEIGDNLDLTLRSAAVGSLRASGGMSLLSPHKRRRAGICQAVTT